MVFVYDMTLDLAKVGLDVGITPACCSQAFPLLVVRRSTLGKHHSIHGTAACFISALSANVVVQPVVGRKGTREFTSKKLAPGPKELTVVESCLRSEMDERSE